MFIFLSFRMPQVDRRTLVNFSHAEFYVSVESEIGGQFVKSQRYYIAFDGRWRFFNDVPPGSNFRTIMLWSRKISDGYYLEHRRSQDEKIPRCYCFAVLFSSKLFENFWTYLSHHQSLRSYSILLDNCEHSVGAHFH